jgi:hypothetical protein
LTFDELHDNIYHKIVLFILISGLQYLGMCCNILW